MKNNNEPTLKEFLKQGEGLDGFSFKRYSNELIIPFNDEITYNELVKVE